MSAHNTHYVNLESCAECYADPGEPCADPVETGDTWPDGTPRHDWQERDTPHTDRGQTTLTLSQRAYDLLFRDMTGGLADD